jgi:hypothetical protein
VSPALGIPTLIGVVSLSAILLFWARLPGSWRRGLAIGLSALGLLFLIAAMGTEGLSESWTVRRVVPGVEVESELTAASASLHYYVLTAACLLLGTTFLAVSDHSAHRMRHHPLATAVLLSGFITGLRFALEKVAAPRHWTYAVGITWLVPLLGVYFLACRPRELRRLGRLARDLVTYALAARGLVAALMIVATATRLGSHYDVSSVHKVKMSADVVLELAPASARQILALVLVPQLVVWPVLTLVLGLLAGGAFTLATRHLGSRATSPARAGR